jgi:hypothetical protein
VRVQHPDAGRQREQYQDILRQLGTGLVPRYELLHTSATTMSVATAATWKGSDRLILPFHEWRDRSQITGNAADAYTVSVPRWVECSPSAIALTGTSTVGGIVDGVALAASGVYLLWAFLMGPGGSFYGYGLTRRPDYLGTPAATALGASGTVTMASAGTANRYTVGARVLVRNGTALGAEYNQGTITAIPAGGASLTIQYDAVYTGMPAATINTALTAAAGRSVIQLDRQAPWIATQSSTGRTTWEGRPFAYLGSIEVNAASQIAGVRRPGEPRWLETPTTILTPAAPIGIANTVICLRRWIGQHVRLVHLEAAIVTAGGGGGNNTFMSLQGGVNYGRFFTSSINNNSATLRAHASIPVTPLYDSLIATTSVDGGTTLNVSAVLRGWDEGDW